MIEKYTPSIPTEEVPIEKIQIEPEEMEIITDPEKETEILEEIQAVPILLFLILLAITLGVLLKPRDLSESIEESSPSPSFPEF